MSRKWVVLYAAAVLALGAGVLGAAAGPAKAAASDCASTYLCVWKDSGFTNSRFQFAGNNTSWAAWAINNEDSSWFNNGTSGLRVQVYDHTNYVTTTICVGY